MKELAPEEKTEGDVLSRWMAHRIAELITLAEESGEPESGQLHMDAANAILELWRHRERWPCRWSAAERLGGSRLDTRTPLAGPAISIPRRITWLDALPLLDQIHEQERDAWLKRAMLEFPLQEAESWVRDYGLEMQEDERAAITRVAAYVRTVLSESATAEASEESPMRGATEVANELEKWIDQSMRARARLRRAVVRGWPQEPHGSKDQRDEEPE